MTLCLWELQLTNVWCYFFATISYTLTSLALLAVFLTMQNVLFRKQSQINIARYYLFFVVFSFFFLFFGGGLFCCLVFILLHVPVKGIPSAAVIHAALLP